MRLAAHHPPLEVRVADDQHGVGDDLYVGGVPRHGRGRAARRLRARRSMERGCGRGSGKGARASPAERSKSGVQGSTRDAIVILVVTRIGEVANSPRILAARELLALCEVRPSAGAHASAISFRAAKAADTGQGRRDARAATGSGGLSVAWRRACPDGCAATRWCRRSPCDGDFAAGRFTTEDSGEIDAHSRRAYARSGGGAD
jgi:hypothetical protein